MAVKKGLGKGLDSLIPKTNSINSDNSEIATEGMTTVSLELVEPNKKQPRKFFDEEELEELANSVKSKGIISPILVQKRDGYYEIIAGERRWRAARKAGLKEVPVIIKDLTDAEIFELALIENVHRQQLNPIEEALAYKRLIEEFSLTQEELSERVSKKRSSIANSMRLLKLEENVQNMIISGEISTGHAKVLLSIEDQNMQSALAERIASEKMSVRDTEKMAKSHKKTEKSDKKKEDTSNDMQAVYAEAEDRLKDILGTKVKFHIKDMDRGSLEIEYYSKEQLEELINKLEA